MHSWWAALFFGLATALQPLPPLEQLQTRRNTTATGFTLGDSPRTIYIQRPFFDISDSQGLTLIPPTACQFAETFRQDLVALFGGNWTLQQVDSLPASGILVGERFSD